MRVPEGGEWTKFRHDLRNTGYSSDPVPDSLTLRWSTHIPEADEFWSSPSVVGGCLYAANRNGNIYCLDASTGSILWMYETGSGEPIFSSPAVEYGMVFFASLRKIHALPAHDPNRDGVISPSEVVWEFRTDGTTGGANDVISGSPAVKDGKLFIGTIDQTFYCFDAVKGGDPIWMARSGYQGLHAYSSSPAIDGGKVFAATGDQEGRGSLSCFDEHSGKVLWSFPLEGITYSTPVVHGDRVYIANSGKWTRSYLASQLYCLDTDGRLDGVDDGVEDDSGQNADLVWRFENADFVFSSPALHDGRLYFGSVNGDLFGLDASEDGARLLWTHSTPTVSGGNPRGIIGSPAIASDKVFVGTEDGRLIAAPLDDPNRDGVLTPDELVWTYPIGGNGICSPTIAYGRVYIGSHQGAIFCFG